MCDRRLYAKHTAKCVEHTRVSVTSFLFLGGVLSPRIPYTALCSMGLNSMSAPV